MDRLVYRSHPTQTSYDNKNVWIHHRHYSATWNPNWLSVTSTLCIPHNTCVFFFIAEGYSIHFLNFIHFIRKGGVEEIAFWDYLWRLSGELPKKSGQHVTSGILTVVSNRRTLCETASRFLHTHTCPVVSSSQCKLRNLAISWEEKTTPAKTACQEEKRQIDSDIDCARRKHSRRVMGSCIRESRHVRPEWAPIVKVTHLK